MASGGERWRAVASGGERWLTAARAQERQNNECGPSAAERVTKRRAEEGLYLVARRALKGAQVRSVQVGERAEET